MEIGNIELISFEEYKERHLNPKPQIKERTKEKIMEDVEEILNGLK